MLPGGDQQRQRLLSLLTRQMNLRGEPASRPAQSMVFRFGAHSAWRFLLHSTAPAGTGSMLVCPADGGVDIDLPEDQPGRISPRLQQRQQPGPHTPTLPSPEQSIHRLPRSVLERQVPPRNSGPNPPPHTVYQPPTARPPATYAHRRQQRLQHRPLLIREIPSPHILIISMQGVHRKPNLKHGLARVTGSATVAHALAAKLLPQWRARPPASRRVAASLGFEELGFQLSIEII